MHPAVTRKYQKQNESYFVSLVARHAEDMCPIWSMDRILWTGVSSLWYYNERDGKCTKFPRPLALRQGRAYKHTRELLIIIRVVRGSGLTPLLAQSHWSLKRVNERCTGHLYPWKRTSSEANRQLTRLRPLHSVTTRNVPERDNVLSSRGAAFGWMPCRTTHRIQLNITNSRSL